MNDVPLEEWKGRIVPANKAPASAGVADGEDAGEWSGRAFWLGWMVATATGWALAGAAGGAVAGALGDFADPRVDAAGYAFMVLAAALQALLLRPRLDHAWRWVPFTLAGLVAGTALHRATVAFLGDPSATVNASLSLIVEGMAVGVAQWLFWRRAAYRASRWLLANLLWISLLTPLFLLGGEGEALAPEIAESAIHSGIVVGLMGLAGGAITGAEAVWLLRRPAHAAGSSRGAGTADGETAKVVP